MSKKKVNVTYQIEVNENISPWDFATFEFIRFGSEKKAGTLVSVEAVKEETMKEDEKPVVVTIPIKVEVPPGYTHVAVDKNGDIYAHSTMPVASDRLDGFLVSSVCGNSKGLSVLNWKDTIVEVDRGKD